VFSKAASNPLRSDVDTPLQRSNNYWTSFAMKNQRIVDKLKSCSQYSAQ